MTKGGFEVFTPSYTADSAVTQFQAVVQGAADGSVANPGAVNAAQFVGITQAAQATAGASVMVRRLGISAFVGHGTIARGDHLAIYSAAGDLYSVETAVAAGLANPAGVVNVVGTAECSVTTSGDIGYMFIHPQLVALAVS
jgi:hypothetical protein